MHSKLNFISIRPQFRGLLISCLFISMLLLFSLPATVLAAKTTEDSDTAVAPKRPKIGLVLAGGGAKGGAHVGVLKVLEEMRIPVDYVAGTSMGSIIGGLYASGMSPDEIEKQIKRIDWELIFEDEPLREDRSFRRKTDDALYVMKAKPGFNDGKIELPLAYVHGQKFDLELNRLTQSVASIKNFDQLPIPYRAVATDLETGKEVVLKSGSLARSLRASMAVPGAFDPVMIDEKMLVDGGISNNIPISVARDMGADVVIVSDLGSEMLTREEITSGFSVAGQMVNFLFSLNSQAALKTLKTEDVHISIELGDIGAGSFNRITETIPLGEEAADNTSKSLKRYSLSEDNYQVHLASRGQPQNESLVIDYIEIDNQSSISEEVIASYLSAEPGKPLDIAELEKDIQQIYGLELFQSVRYELEEKGGQTGLKVTAEEKAWGPGYLQLGLITSSTPEGDGIFNIGVAYTKTEINELNGEWRLALQVGDEPGIVTEIYQPLDPRGNYFTSASLGYGVDKTNTFDRSGNKLSEIRGKSYQLNLGIGRQFGTWGQVKLGYFRATGTAEVDVGPDQPDRDFDSGSFSVQLTADKLDSLYFPTKGHFANLGYLISSEEFGADTDFEQINLDLLKAASWGKHTLIGRLSLHTTVDDDAPFQSLYQLGGFLKLSGYEEDRLTGQHSGLASAIYMRRIADLMFFESYFGASLELGNVWQDQNDVDIDDTIFAGSVFLGADTPMGPMYLSYGHNDDGDNSIYLFMGPLFSF